MLKPFDLQALSIFLCIKVALVTEPAAADGDFFLPADLRIIGEEAFAGSSMTYAELPLGTREIRARAFAECSSLESGF